MSENSQPLTLKKLQMHFIVALVVCCATAIFSSFITVNAFYYNTKNDIMYLKDITTENVQSIKQLNQTLQENKTPATINQVEVNNLKNEVQDIKNRQTSFDDKLDKIYNVLLELKTRR